MKKNLSVLLLFAACSSSNQHGKALQTIKDFIGWYGANYDEANSFRLVNQGDSVFYSVNFNETEEFLSYLKTSGFVSDAYLNDFRTHFQKAEENFKAHPVNDGPPEGFDYDIVLLTQEPELVIEKANNPVILSSKIEDNNALITLEIGMPLQFSLSKQNGKWMIDKISYFDEGKK